MTRQQTFRVRTRGRGTTDLTAEVEQAVRASGVATGTCNVFLQHTSASLILCENADPTVRHDLETIIGRLAPGTWQGIYLWEHRRAPHARSVVVTVSGDNAA